MPINRNERSQSHCGRCGSLGCRDTLRLSGGLDLREAGEDGGVSLPLVEVSSIPLKCCMVRVITEGRTTQVNTRGLGTETASSSGFEKSSGASGAQVGAHYISHLIDRQRR